MRRLLGIMMPGLLAMALATTVRAGDDIEIWYDEGMIKTGDFTISSPFPVKASIFPVADPFTLDPGLDGTISPNHAIVYNVLSTLQFHDGNAFGSAGSASIIMESAGTNFDDVTVSATDILGGGAGGKVGSGLWGQATTQGVVHFHVSFELFDPVPTPGAYGIWMTLSSYTGAMGDSGIADSDGFWVVWNHGLGATEFAAAQQAFSQVPEPASLGVVLLGGLALLRRHRRQVLA